MGQSRVKQTFDMMRTKKIIRVDKNDPITLYAFHAGISSS